MSNGDELTLLVLAAGRGARMRNSLPKVMHPLAGRSLIGHVLGLGDECGAKHVCVVLAPGMDEVAGEIEKLSPGAKIALQHEALGTGNAVRAALDALPNTGTIAMIYGDTPLVTPNSVRKLHAKRQKDDLAVVVMAMRPPIPDGYGRLKTGANGELEAIVEHVVADEQLRATAPCNSGIMAIDAAKCRQLVESIPKQSHNGEYYLTDIVEIARNLGWRCGFETVPFEEGHGINNQAQLAEAHVTLQSRIRLSFMNRGVIITAPETVHAAFDTAIGAGAVIEPFVTFGPGVTVEPGATVRSFSHIEGAVIRQGAIVGPYARIRPGSDIGPNARIGNFVETKNAKIDAGAKANHLAYLGDCSIGPRANIGAGTITCNYDGFNKSRTEIGANVFVGSNSALVAPVAIAEGAIVGAGSTITKDVAANSVALTRAAQSVREGAAEPLRRRLAEKKVRSDS